MYSQKLRTEIDKKYIKEKIPQCQVFSIVFYLLILYNNYKPEDSISVRSCSDEYYPMPD